MSYLNFETITANTLWVDAINGNDTTGTRGRQDLPFETIAAALTDTTSGDLVLVRPGTYDEVLLDQPSSTTLRSTGGAGITTIGTDDPSDPVATEIRVIVGRNTTLDGFTIELPDQLGLAAIHCSHGGTSNALIQNIDFIGNDGGQGIGLILDTTGNMEVKNIRFADGDCLYVLDAARGVLKVDGFDIPNRAGTVESGIKLHTGVVGEISNVVMNGSNPLSTMNNGIEIGPHQVTLVIAFTGTWDNNDTVTIGTTEVTLTGMTSPADAAAAYVANFPVGNYEIIHAEDNFDDSVTVLVQNQEIADINSFSSSSGSATFTNSTLLEVQFNTGTYTALDTVTVDGTSINLVATGDRNIAAAAYNTNLNVVSPTGNIINSYVDGKRVYVNLIAGTPATGSYIGMSPSGDVEFEAENPQMCSAVIRSIDLSAMANGITLSTNGYDVAIISGSIDATAAQFKVQDGLDGNGGVFRAQVQMDPKFNIPTGWIPSDHGWTFFTKDDPAQEASYQIWGVDQAIGHPEFGSGLSVGEGLSYSTKNTVFTAAMADPTDDGINIIDVSVQAKSKESSTFSFDDGLSPGGADAQNNVIMWCTNRKDADDNVLKYWGIEMDQVIGAEHSGSSSFLWEIKIGNSPDVWETVNVQAVSNLEQYRYANNVFLRAGSFETIRVGIDNSTDWPETDVSGPGGTVSGHWMRVRIIDADLSIAPTFERMKMIPSHTQANSQGKLIAKGLSMWKTSLLGSGNIWGEGSSQMKNTDPVVGSGPTWIQKNKKSRFEAAGAYNTFQFTLPGGMCTAYPLKFNLTFSTPDVSNLIAVDLTMRALPLRLEGTKIANVNGDIVPVARVLTDASDYTNEVPLEITLTSEPITVDKIKTIGFEFDFSDYYEDDLILLQIQAANDTSGSATLSATNALDMWTLNIEGVAFTEGKIL